MNYRKIKSLCVFREQNYRVSDIGGEFLVWYSDGGSSFRIVSRGWRRFDLACRSACLASHRRWREAARMSIREGK